jgi:hypothetical protein
MDDTKIAKPIVAEEPVVTTPAKPEEVPVDPNSPEERAELIPQEGWRFDPLFHEASHFLGVDEREVDAYAEKISSVINFCIQKNNSREPEQIFSELRKIDESLYRMDPYEKKINIIYRYLQLAVKRDSVTKAMTAMERNSPWN